MIKKNKQTESTFQTVFDNLEALCMEGIMLALKFNFSSLPSHSYMDKTITKILKIQKKKYFMRL